MKLTHALILLVVVGVVLGLLAALQGDLLTAAAAALSIVTVGAYWIYSETRPSP